MESYVYQTHVDYQNAGDVLHTIRETVTDLKRGHPELKACSLADVGFFRKKDGIDVTLYFELKD